MITFKKLLIRNFMSVGKMTQEVNLNGDPLSIIVGLNNDSISEQGIPSRNGTGKSTILQAIHYCLFGRSIENKIKLGNLINKTNKKLSEVTMHFTVNGVDYILERKKKPDSLHFYVDGTKGIVDEAQGENKETQVVINETLNLTPQLFCQIITLTSAVQPFLEVSSGKQREIMEELLGVTQLSTKATLLKELNKETKNSISQESFKIETIKSSNLKIEESIKNIELAENTHNDTIKRNIVLETEVISTFSGIDFQQEISKFDIIRSIAENNALKVSLTNEIAILDKKSTDFINDNTTKLNVLNKDNEKYATFDFEEEVNKHTLIEKYNVVFNEIQVYNTNITTINRDINRYSTSLIEVMASSSKAKTQLSNLTPDACPTCGSGVNDDTFNTIVEEYNAIYEGYIEKESQLNEYLKEENAKLDAIGSPPVLPEMPLVEFSTIGLVYDKMRYVESLEAQIRAIPLEVNPYLVKMTEAQLKLEDIVILEKPEVLFSTVSEVHQCENQLSNAVIKIKELKSDINPYSSQIVILKDTLHVVDYEELNRLNTMFDHQTFLLKLLTSKDSFVRKRIIDQNINFLNSRLDSYLYKTGLPHKVTFVNDLTVDITHMGLSYDFGNLSRGEKTRCILAMSLAFRDTFEALHQSVNFMMLDELLDLGICNSGILSAYDMINEFAVSRNKNVFLVSHREEILEKNVSVIMVSKSNGFTDIDQS